MSNDLPDPDKLEGLIYQETAKGFSKAVLADVSLIFTLTRISLSIKPFRGEPLTTTILAHHTDEFVAQLIQTEASLAWLEEFEMELSSPNFPHYLLTLDILEPIINDIFAQHGILVVPKNIDGAPYLVLTDWFQQDDSGRVPILGNPIDVADFILNHATIIETARSTF